MTENERIILGLVTSGVLRIDPDGSIWRIQTRTRTGRPRTLPTPTRADHPTDTGYRAVRVGVNGREVRALAHRIVWMAKNGPIPDGFEVNHDDGRRGHNELANLDPMTKSDNIRHSYEKLGRWRPSGERCKLGKPKSDQVSEIRSRRAAGDRVGVLAAEFGVSRQTIRRIAAGETWRDQFPEVVTG